MMTPDEATRTELFLWMIRYHLWEFAKIVWRVMRRPFLELVSFLLAVDISGDLHPDTNPVTFIVAFAFIWVGARTVFKVER